MPNSTASKILDPRRFRLLRREAFGLSACVIISILMAWAVGYALLSSFGFIGLLSEGPTLAHWLAASRGGVVASVVLSVMVSATVTAIAAATALSLVLFARETLSRPWALGLLCVPLAMPVAVAAFVVYQFLSGGGLLARFAAQAGWITSAGDFPILVNDSLAVGIVCAHWLSATPLLTLFFRQTGLAVGVDRFTALAESLGASSLQSRLRVALPLLLRRGRSILLLVFILTLGSFEIPLILGSQSPQMVSVLIERKVTGFDLIERPEAFALACSYFAITAALLALFFRWRHADA